MGVGGWFGAEPETRAGVQTVREVILKSKQREKETEKKKPT